MNEESETRYLCVENRLNIMNDETDLSLKLIGQKITIDDRSKNFKVLIIQLNRYNSSYDFRMDIQTAMEYYTEKIKDSLSLSATKLLYLKKSDTSPVLDMIREKFKDMITIATDSTDCIVNRFSVSPKGTIVLLLNKDNICLYAFYLEQNNERKIYENSPVMFNLIRSLQ